MDRLAGARIFIKFNLKDTYHKIRIKISDEWKTAFRTRYSHFKYTVMSFGLTNAPAIFQAYINDALHGLLDIIYIIYLDDILIFNNLIEEYADHVRAVLNRLVYTGYTVN